MLEVISGDAVNGNENYFHVHLKSWCNGTACTFSYVLWIMMDIWVKPIFEKEKM